MRQKFIRRVIVPGVLCLGIWVVLEQVGKPSADRFIAPDAVQEHVLEVFGRNADELEENPDVLGLIPSPGTGEIWIITDRPMGMPTVIEDVPVQIKPAPPHLPPPPGVILLKPRFERVPWEDPPQRSEEDMLPIQEAHPELDTCPPGYREVRRYRWRFCNPENNLQIVPAPMAPPIAGIPHDEAEAIFKRHQTEIMALPGVSSGGLGADGIHIETNQPELVPDHFEGLPVKTGPVQHWVGYRPTLG